MAPSPSQLFVFSLSFSLICLSFARMATSLKACPITFCDFGAPLVHFPFRLRGDYERCGYPGFDLSCDGNDTTIQLPNSSGKFIVQNIDYTAQAITIKDPNLCLPRRLLYSGFSLSGSPFQPENPAEFTFYNCSSDRIPGDSGLRFVPCLTGVNFTVWAAPVSRYNEFAASTWSCSVIANVSIPFLWPSWDNLQNGVRMKWMEPDCSSCTERGGICRFKNIGSLDMDIGCDVPSAGGLPRSAKYGIIIGVAIPGLLCFIGLVCYMLSKIRAYYDHPSLDFSTSIIPQPAALLTGLDGSTIESFPKIQLGESGRLPKPNDNTCPICLSEYQPKEILRTIPECNHYFHADCIDEWLRMNATCPLCRNSPHDSDIMTSSSSSSSSSTSSSLSSPRSIP